ncbi:integrin alpha-V isoform X2 [Brienomyrus brachyistius]|uniref:integrin alpha-V isoform X2 n=1 Tax=Brienomyrus brachyistius TaxID=42636 RepID=UPI0020B3E9BD|nr:integrin alpha-V isoform X2 [Brienomyrus brachyistius]
MMDKRRTICLLLSLVFPHFKNSHAFNLDIEKPSVYSGPLGSYFGFSVDFFKPNDRQLNVLIGAPKANASVSAVLERGAVYDCPWQSSANCKQIQFDDTDDRKNADGVQMEFKSNQWFGATVRSEGDHILACAPLYQWSTLGLSEREPVGTCFLKKGGKTVEYSPCRSALKTPEGQGFCQAGFSIDFLKNNRVVVGGPGSFYWQGQLISDNISEIISRYNSKEFFTLYSEQLSTKPASAQYDDSYLGYSVTVGDLNNDGDDDYVTGVPRGEKALGYVNVFNGRSMESMANFTGMQMAAYFGYSVAATDINNDGVVDLFVGAPLFMDRGSDGKLREVGQVYTYLGKGGFSFHTQRVLTGLEVYSRFGSCIAALGDLDMDGFNDIAIAAPYGGPDHSGLVYIHNGRATGPDSVASQVLEGKWASSYMPPSFGYSMHGATDIDLNGYPDLIVGAFGADKAVLYRARPVVSINATLDITPQILNPEDKYCDLAGSSSPVSCFTVKYCLQARGHGAPNLLRFKVELLLDKLKQKGAVKRVLFLHSRTSQYPKNLTVPNGRGLACEELQAFLIDDSEFRDKITPIMVFMEYSLDYSAPADRSGLQPILDQFAPANISKQAHILLDCGDDNICKPELKLSVVSDQEQMYIGDDNPLTLQVTAENSGEGAYEAELLVSLPPQADFIGVVRNSQMLSRLSCAYKIDNQTRFVVCDLGNPMKGGTKLVAGLRFSVHQLSEQDTAVKFDLQIQSSNQFNNTSNLVSSVTKLAVLAKMEIRGVSAPDQVFLPIANWQPKDPPAVEDDIGPLVQHIYELRNNGPSTVSKAMVDIQCPYRLGSSPLLYITSYEVDGPMNCSTSIQINPLNVSNPTLSRRNASVVGGERSDEGRRSRRDVEGKKMDGNLDTLDCVRAECLHIKCQVGRLERGKGAILFVRSRLGVATFLKAENQNRSYVVRSTGSFSVIEMPYKNLEIEFPSNSTVVNTAVIWVTTDYKHPVPGWVITLAVLAGLLLLALLIFIMYKLGFFNRVRPPQDDFHDKEHLQPLENGDGNTDA